MLGIDVSIQEQRCLLEARVSMKMVNEQSIHQITIVLSIPKFSKNMNNFHESISKSKELECNRI